MAIILKDDTNKGITFDSYNKLNRIETLDLSTGSGSIRMAKYASEEYRTENPSDLIENRDFHSIELSGEDLTTLQDMIYKYISELGEYKDGTKV